MKKLLISMLAAVFLCTGCAPSMMGEESEPQQQKSRFVEEMSICFTVGDSELLINGEKVTVRQPYLLNDTTLVPVRVITEAFGCDVGWEESTQTVTIEDHGREIQLVIDNPVATVDGSEVTLLAPPQLNVDTTMVPLRFISETFGADVTYDETTEQITVTKRLLKDAVPVNQTSLTGAKNMILSKTKKLDQRIGAQFPEGTDDGVYETSEFPGWTAGFYPGLNYLCYDMSGDEEYLSSARAASSVIDMAFNYNNQVFSHDIGFVYMDSFYKEYLETGSEDAKQKVIEAGDALMERVKPTGYIQAWDIWGNGENEFGLNNQYRMIADTMCNLSLLFTCTDLTGDSKYADAAVKHAQMTQQYIIRPDGTSAHTFVFKPDGSPNFEQTHQGYADDSCWARGQAWIVNGMATCYLETGNESFLESAKQCADVFFDMTEDDMIPTWDLSLQGQKLHPRDTSAASILACGLLNIWEATGDGFYFDAAYRIFNTLYEDYTTNLSEEGIIGQAVGNYPGGSYINCSLIYGDYYFAELTQRLINSVSE